MQLDIMTESHGVTLNMREARAMSPCLQYTGRIEKNVWVSLPHETLVFCSMSRTRRSVIRITRMRSHFCARMQSARQATIDRGVLWRRKCRHKKIRASMGEFQAPALADFPSSWPAEVPALATPYISTRYCHRPQKKCARMRKMYDYSGVYFHRSAYNWMRSQASI